MSCNVCSKSQQLQAQFINCILILYLIISVPIIPVYLNNEKPTTGPQIADNATTTSSPITTDSSMDFKIGALFASKAFVQACKIYIILLQNLPS